MLQVVNETSQSEKLFETYGMRRPFLPSKVCSLSKGKGSSPPSLVLIPFFSRLLDSGVRSPDKSCHHSRAYNWPPSLACRRCVDSSEALLAERSVMPSLKNQAIIDNILL
ncbi:hypothetical protein HL42_0595 [Trichophyton rubrum]|nr:hypothetical protein HL42_0595 [Trichophyton rubrum]